VKDRALGVFGVNPLVEVHLAPDDLGGVSGRPHMEVATPEG